jgi:hypothetical protein
VEGVQVAHGLGGEQGALVAAGGQQPGASVAALGEVGDGLVDQRLVDEPEALAGTRPRLTRW